MRSVPVVVAVFLALVLAGVPHLAFAQGPERSARFDRTRTPARAETPVFAPEPGDAGAPGVWTAAAVGAGVGAVVGGAVGYVAHHRLLDPWLTRGQYAAVTAAEGAVVGAGVGVAVALIRRWWARAGAEGAGGGSRGHGSLGWKGL